MITIKDFMETTNYRITEGSEYCWQCFGPNAHQFDSWNGIHGQGGYTVCMVFDTNDQTVYSFEAWDYTNDRCYRWINPDFIDAYKQECQARDIDYDEAFDDIKFIDIDVAEDILEKARAIVAGEEYDTRVQMEVRFTDEELLTYMKIAHDRDITFNQLVEIALQEALDQHRMLNDIPFPKIQEHPFPATNFTKEQAREVVKKIKKKKNGKK